MVSGSLGSSSASVREPQRPTQSLRGNRAMGQRVIHRAVPTSMLSGQRQLDQRTDRAIRAQDRVGELERRARPRGVGPVELPPEPVEFAWPQPGVPRGGARPIRHTLINAATAFVFDVLWKEPEEDQAVAAPRPKRHAVRAASTRRRQREVEDQGEDLPRKAWFSSPARPPRRPVQERAGRPPEWAVAPTVQPFDRIMARRPPASGLRERHQALNARYEAGTAQDQRNCSWN
jgi:hypothetical protein